MGFVPKGNQKCVIKYKGDKPLLVEAGPGSGKTAVIVERIKYLIDEGVEPESFLVITFTKKAAQNLKNRLKKHLDKKDLDKMQISTIHSFCLDYLKEKEIAFDLIDDETSERKSLLIQKYAEEKLGFKKESTLRGYQVGSVMDKYEEFTAFNVDDEALIEYIKENHPVDPDYVDLVNSNEYFPRLEVKDEGYNNDWRNARFLQVAKSYKQYLKLLEERGAVDYNTVQLRTLEELKKDPQTKYQTIFVDEFQDTDPLQYEIFRILKDNCDYFTAVGDVDQHIYGFRSSFIDYFEQMQEECDVERISLNCNFRSTQDIVKVTDTFIRDLRDENSLKQLESNNREYNNPTFLLESADEKTEAQRIFDIIQHLKQTGKIKDYGEVGVLYRKHSNKTIEELINLFRQHNDSNPEKEIDFTIKGQSDLAKQDEIRSIITMLWYITRKTHYGYILSSDELDEMNLKAFCGDYFEPTFWSLTDQTKEYLRDLQDSFYADIVQKRKDVREEVGKSSSRITSHATGGESLENLRKIYTRVKVPEVDLSKVADEDKEFFKHLNDLREDVLSEEPPLIFNLFYELLQFGDLFSDVKKNTAKLKNLAVVSQTIFNYSDFMSSTDVKGFYFFLTNVIKGYTSNTDEETGVQMMTIHSAKGLEFPVTIVASLEENEFPIPAKDPERKKTTLNRKDAFYTPLEYFEYKKFLLEREEFKGMKWNEIEDKLNDDEELRVIYVAMTRAADLLILSSLKEVPEKIEEIRCCLKPLTSLEDLDDVTIEKHFTNQEEEPMNMTFSKYNSYTSCPFYFNMSYNMGFRHAKKTATDLGNVFHNVMEDVNKKLIKGESMSGDDLENDINDVYFRYFTAEDDPDDYDKLHKNIVEFVNNKAGNFDVIGTEYPFSVDGENYELTGAIDLIYRISDTEIGILDYKYAECDPEKKESYSRQLFTYASALRKLPEFKDYDIKEGRICFIRSNDEPVFEITDELIKQQEDRLADVVVKMENEEYETIIDLKPDKEHSLCDYCNFKDICESRK